MLNQINSPDLMEVAWQLARASKRLLLAGRLSKIALDCKCLLSYDQAYKGT
jgi:hypothetical protein